MTGCSAVGRGAVPELPTLFLTPVVDLLRAVHGGQVSEKPLQGVGEILVSRVHAGEQGVAAGAGHLGQVEDTAHRRLGIRGNIGMPPDTPGRILRRFVSTKYKQFRLSRVPGAEDRMDVQFAEQAGERLVLLHSHVLITEEDDLVFHEGIVNLREGLVAQRPRQIDAADLGADAGRQRIDLDRLVGHLAFLRTDFGCDIYCVAKI